MPRNEYRIWREGDARALPLTAHAQLNLAPYETGGAIPASRPAKYECALAAHVAATVSAAVGALALGKYPVGK